MECHRLADNGHIISGTGDDDLNVTMEALA